MTDAEACLVLRDIGACECCQTTDDAKLRPSMTQYHFDGPWGSDADPNRQWMGCETCWLEYEEHWQAMWDEYRAGLL
jgi:hypothetical protein